MRKGFAGLLVLSVFLLGFVLIMSSQSPRISDKGYSSIVAAEVKSDRIAIARNVILRSYRMVDEKNRAAWAESVQSLLPGKYGLRVSINFQKFPPEANVTDPETGMSTSFLLT